MSSLNTLPWREIALLRTKTIGWGSFCIEGLWFLPCTCRYFRAANNLLYSGMVYVCVRARTYNNKVMKHDWNDVRHEVREW